MALRFASSEPLRSAPPMDCLAIIVNPDAVTFRAEFSNALSRMLPAASKETFELPASITPNTISRCDRTPRFVFTVCSESIATDPWELT